MGVTMWEICSGGAKLPPVTQRVLEVLPLSLTLALSLTLQPCSYDLKPGLNPSPTKRP